MAGITHGSVGVTGGVGIITYLLCNVNCPGSCSCSSLILTLDIRYEYWGDDIFAARVLQVGIARMGDFLDKKQRYVAVYSPTIASNRGVFTTCASLAGPLWRDILRRNRIDVHQWQLCRLNLPLVIVSTVASTAVLVGEVCVVRKG